MINEDKINDKMKNDEFKSLKKLRGPDPYNSLSPNLRR